MQKLINYNMPMMMVKLKMDGKLMSVALIKQPNVEVRKYSEVMVNLELEHTSKDQLNYHLIKE